MIQCLKNQLASLVPSDDPVVQSAQWTLYTCYVTLCSLEDKQVPNGNLDYDARDRECTLVCIGIPESNDPKPSQRNRSDFNICTDLLDRAGVESPLLGCCRLGRSKVSDGKPDTRLLKMWF